MFGSERTKRTRSEKITFFKHNFNGLKVNELGLLSNKKWEKKILNEWNVGEINSLNIMKSFFENGVKIIRRKKLSNKKMCQDYHPSFIGVRFPNN